MLPSLATLLYWTLLAFWGVVICNVLGYVLLAAMANAAYDQARRRLDPALMAEHRAAYRRASWFAACCVLFVLWLALVPR